jgi:hypothetical protein
MLVVCGTGLVRSTRDSSRFAVSGFSPLPPQIRIMTGRACALAVVGRWRAEGEGVARRRQAGREGLPLSATSVSPEKGVWVKLGRRGKAREESQRLAGGLRESVAVSLVMGRPKSTGVETGDRPRWGRDVDQIRSRRWSVPLLSLVPDGCEIGLQQQPAAVRPGPVRLHAPHRAPRNGPA